MMSVSFDSKNLSAKMKTTTKRCLKIANLHLFNQGWRNQGKGGSTGYPQISLPYITGGGQIIPTKSLLAPPPIPIEIKEFAQYSKIKEFPNKIE